MGKLLRVFFVAAVMAALCLVPALAAPVYPSDLPPLPDIGSFLDSGLGLSGDDMCFVVVDWDGDLGMFIYQNAEDFYWYDNFLWCCNDNPVVSGYVSYNSRQGRWMSDWPIGYQSWGSDWAVGGDLRYANCTIYDMYGAPLYPNGYPEGPVIPPDILPDEFIPSGYPSDLPRLPNFEYYSTDNVDTVNLFAYYLVFEDSAGDLFLIATMDPWDNMTYYNGSLYPLDDPETGKTQCSTFRCVDGEWVCILPMDYHDVNSAFVTGDIVFGTFTPVSDRPDEDMIPYEGPKPVPPKPEVPSHSYQNVVGDDGEVEDPDVEPGTPMEDLNLVVGSIFGILTQIYNLYAGTWLLTGFLMLWLIRRVSKLFNRL